MKKENLLNSWKEIANYLDIHVRTCHRWEEKFGLPIHRFEEAQKSRVYAYKSELDKWLEEGGRNKSTLITSSSKKRIWIIVASFFALAALFFILYFTIFKVKEVLLPDGFRINGSILIAIDDKGKELWQHDFKINNLVSEQHYQKRFQIKRPNPEKKLQRHLPQLIIRDIDQDAFPEVLFSTQTVDGYGGGELFCFNYIGKLLWKYDVGRELIFGSKIYSADYLIHGFDLYDVNKDGNLEIILTSRQKPDFPTSLFILNKNGDILGEYWNAGRFTDFVFEDLNGDRKEELIVTGMNNEYEKPCLIVLDPNNLRGSSPQKDEYYICKEFDKGSELFYILIPKIEFLNQETLFEFLSTVDILKNHRLSVVTSHSRITFEFDYDLKIADIKPSHETERIYNTNQQKLNPHFDLNDEYFKNLESRILYYNGTEWTDQVTGNIKNNISIQ